MNRYTQNKTLGVTHFNHYPKSVFFFSFYIPVKVYKTDLLVTLLTEYLTTLQGRCHWVQNTMTTPWHHKKLRRFTYELQKKKKSRHEKEANNTTLSQTRYQVKNVHEIIADKMFAALWVIVWAILHFHRSHLIYRQALHMIIN